MSEHILAESLTQRLTHPHVTTMFSAVICYRIRKAKSVTQGIGAPKSRFTHAHWHKGLKGWAVGWWWWLWHILATMVIMMMMMIMIHSVNNGGDTGQYVQWPMGDHHRWKNCVLRKNQAGLSWHKYRYRNKYWLSNNQFLLSPIQSSCEHCKLKVFW